MFHSVEEIKQIDELNFLNALNAEGRVGVLNSSVVIDEIRNLSPHIEILRLINDFPKRDIYRPHGDIRLSKGHTRLFFKTMPETVKWVVIDQKDIESFYGSESLKKDIPAHISIYIRCIPDTQNQWKNYYLLRYRLIEIPTPLMPSQLDSLAEDKYVDYDGKDKEKLVDVLKDAEIISIDKHTSIETIRSFKNNPHIRGVKFNGIVNVAQIIEIGLNPNIEVIELNKKFFSNYRIRANDGEDNNYYWPEKLKIVLAAIRPTLRWILLSEDLLANSRHTSKIFRQDVERVASLLPVPISFYTYYYFQDAHHSELYKEFFLYYRPTRILASAMLAQWLFSDKRPGGKAYLALTADGRFIADIKEQEVEHIFVDAAYQLHSQARNIKIENPSNEVDLTKGTVDSELLDQMPMLYELCKNEEPDRGAESLTTRTILEELAEDNTGLEIAESDEEESEVHDQINLASEQHSEAEILEKDKQNFLAILSNKEAATKVAELNNTTDIENIQALSPEVEIIHLEGMFFRHFRGGVYMNHRKRVRPLWKEHAAFIFEEIPPTVKWAYFYRACVPFFFDEVCDALKTAIPSHVTLYCKDFLDSNFTLLRMRESELVVSIMLQQSMNDSMKLDRVANEKELTSLLDMIDDETREMANSESDEDEWRVIYRGNNRHNAASAETEDEGELTEIEDIGGDEMPALPADVVTLPRRPTQKVSAPHQIKLSDYNVPQTETPPLLRGFYLTGKRKVLWDKEVQQRVAELKLALQSSSIIDTNQMFKNALRWTSRFRKQVHKAKDGSSGFPILEKRNDADYSRPSAEEEREMIFDSADIMISDILALLKNYPELQDKYIQYSSVDIERVRGDGHEKFHCERNGERLYKYKSGPACGGQIVYHDQLNQGAKERSQYTQTSATVFKTPAKKVIANQPPEPAPQTTSTNLRQAIEPPLKRARLNEEDELNRELRWRLQSKLEPKLQHSAFKPCREHLPLASKQVMLGWKSSNK